MVPGGGGALRAAVFFFFAAIGKVRKLPYRVTRNDHLLLTRLYVNSLKSMSRGLGIRLREARLASGLTAKVVGEQIGRGPLSIYRWEWGTTEPGIEQLRALAKLYRVTLDWLVSGEATPRRKSLPPCA